MNMRHNSQEEEEDERNSLRSVNIPRVRPGSNRPTQALNLCDVLNLLNSPGCVPTELASYSC